ncbi:hypothetical protein TNCT_576391, partial [Trichonephila clavata]
MDEEESKLWKEALIALTISLSCVFSLGIIIFIKNIIFFKSCSIEAFNCPPLLFYFSALFSIYRQSQPEVPPIS